MGPVVYWFLAPLDTVGFMTTDLGVKGLIKLSYNGGCGLVLLPWTA